MTNRTVTLTTIDHVELEADVATVPTEVTVRGAIVIAHPHPLYGGSRFDSVVGALFGRLPSAGFHCLRFDFRGVGHSTGEHDGGDSERLDVAAGVDFLSGIEDDVWIAGYSFGAMVALAVVEPRVRGWIAIAPPLSHVDGEALASNDARPTLILSPEHDQFTPYSEAQRITSDWTNTTCRPIAMADHFLAGRTETTADLVCDWLTSR